MTVRNLAASVRAKLLNRARDSKQDFNLVLTRFALERLLYRMSISSHHNAFLLKGALLFDLWFDIPYRPTRDADFLSFGSAELPHLQSVFKEICEIAVDDGILFQSDTVSAAEIRKDSNYAGVRVTLLGVLDGARCHVQVDIGFGDAVTPSPESVEYPVILPDFEAPKLRVYPRYTVVAEKFHALVTLGIANNRMKDYFDLWVLSEHAEFDGQTLRQAMEATFERRKTPIPEQIPFGLPAGFTEDTQKQTHYPTSHKH
ncbi:MAG: nucleotidyl transferase AbiEii/AbiGii toxin family protein [Hahellaceae bacterium]|nr:nucleotidyl transferase AbiEii/AbiGii toxin family protein [Hahellaceae bacterium]MCP5209944.1 nucleotidyl transferase AbiEii/AbiGii toxin family protein [Hahellaceae bacterium]